MTLGINVQSMTLPGWMPGAKVLPAPTTNFTKGRLGVAVKALVLHIAEGGYAGSAAWLTNPASGVSAHFIVSKAGEITQMVSILDTAWANGLSWNGSTWIDPEGNHVSPAWKGLTPPTNPNFQTVSVEHEGHSGDVWTPAEVDADARIAKFVATVYPLTWQPRTTLLGHFDISPIARAHCPGPGCPFDRIALLANGSSGGGVDYPKIWGTAYPFFEASGIAQEWKRSAMVLGAAASDETKDAEGRVWRLFHGGAVSYDPRSGACMSYFARASS